MSYDDWKLQNDLDEWPDEAPFISFECRREQHNRCGDPQCDDSCHDKPEEQ